MQTAIIIVDHGSRRDESNEMLEEVARAFAARFTQRFQIVEPAHMELSEPSVATAYAKCAQRGAQRIVVLPYFLGPGKHWTQDIPRLAADASKSFPNTRYHVSKTLGIDDLMLQLLAKRIDECISDEYMCAACKGTLRS